MCFCGCNGGQTSKHGVWNVCACVRVCGGAEGGALASRCAELCCAGAPGTALNPPVAGLLRPPAPASLGSRPAVHPTPAPCTEALAAVLRGRHCPSAAESAAQVGAQGEGGADLPSSLHDMEPMETQGAWARFWCALLVHPNCTPPKPMAAGRPAFLLRLPFCWPADARVLVSSMHMHPLLMHSRPCVPCSWQGSTLRAALLTTLYLRGLARLSGSLLLPLCSGRGFAAARRRGPWPLPSSEPSTPSPSSHRGSVAHSTSPLPPPPSAAPLPRALPSLPPPPSTVHFPGAPPTPLHLPLLTCPVPPLRSNDLQGGHGHQ